MCSSETVMSPGRSGKFGAVVGAMLAFAVALVPVGDASAQDRPVPDTFEATTTGMTPDGLRLKIDVLEWSGADARADVIEALSGNGDISAALQALPSAGVVWRDGSAVGHSVKYAHRQALDDGRERVTIVTDKALDSFSFRPWEMPGRTGDDRLAYSVIQLVVGEDGNGTGTISPAADIAIDADAGLVTLNESTGAAVLTAARELPKPYWVNADGG